MTRFARGASGNQKRPLDASSWSELKTKQVKNGNHSSQSSSTSSDDYKKTVKHSKDTNIQQGSLKFKGDLQPNEKSYQKKKEEHLRKVLHKEKRSEQRRLKRVKKRENEVVCYNCRESGHQMSECPDIKTDMEQGTGICFKCGSTEHVSASCSVKLPKGQYPYAKCFVCGETGHLSKQCPDNPRGLYPMGGCCKICESVEHYQRDCPEQQQQQGIGGYRLHTRGKWESADAELEEAISKPTLPKKAGPKIVKF